MCVAYSAQISKSSSLGIESFIFCTTVEEGLVAAWNGGRGGRDVTSCCTQLLLKGVWLD